ncbi:MAG: C10 family peptidase [Bacteroidales bacterium]|nr:C10 family peptidase [Bacteroidales bacterium]
MKKYQILLVYLTLIIGITSYSQQVSLETAQKVASHFITINTPLDGPLNQESFQVTDCFIKSQDEQVVYFVFNLSPKGFIIISGDYRAVPILGYSFHSNYDPYDIPPALKAWMESYSVQIINIKNHYNGDELNEHKFWSYYLDANVQTKQKSEQKNGIEPLIRSIWEQGKYYNDSCPEHPDGPGGHCYAGCVAVAMAQLMFYYRYPETGTGSITYTPAYNDTIYANFGNTTFHWNEMVNYIYGMRNPAVADLIFKVGASIQTSYSPYGSGSYTHFCVDALKNYFRYDSSSMVHLFRMDTTISWKDTLIKNLDNLQPVIYAGGSWLRHSFVCDAYQDTSYFHFNFGWWNGSGNGYYYLDDITPFHYNFTAQQNAVFNIYPSGNYPPYASAYDTLTAPRGTFEDGSGPLPYLNNTDSYWLIAPDDSVQIMLYFDRFETNPGDIVTVYDGEDTNAAILGTYYGNNIPYTVNSSGNRMLIHFLTNEQDNAQGWFAYYISVNQAFCQSWAEYTDTIGYIHDGSGIFYDYMNMTDCYWYIHPQGYYYDSISGITLSILDFATEENNDFLTIYDGPTIDHPVLEIISGINYPGEISSNSNQMLISFNANESITNAGFLASYNVHLPVYCQDTVIITASAGSINDGSGPKRYSKNSDCYWLIEPDTDSDTIYLTFTDFDLEYGYDWVEVIDFNANPPTLLGHFTGDQIPQTIKADHGAMLIHFYSDISITKTGWEAQFSIGSQNIQEADNVKLISIHPNPAKEHFHIELSSPEEINMDFELISITGSTLIQGTQGLKRGVNTITINCQKLPADLYILKMKFEGSIIHRKVIIQ